MSMRQRFEQFFLEANDGHPPHRWQVELMERVAHDGRWPAGISAPTGAGKTAVIDIHVFLVAEWQRQRTAGTPTSDLVARIPRRLVLVAPRRVLVDDQHERARSLAVALAGAEGGSGPLAEVAEALRELTTSKELVASEKPEASPSPLGVARLRGGLRIDTAWRLDPSQCQVISTTPKMWGSRLLLRGYRSTRRARNLETGLLAHDATAIVDEAHLNQRLVSTARRIANYQGDHSTSLQVVAMSATQEVDGEFRIDEEHVTEELARRVRAPKRLVVHEVEDWKKEATPKLVERAKELAGKRTVGVFVNTVERALEVEAKLPKDATKVVVCGRMRPADLQRIRAEYDGLLGPEGNASVDFLVSTQSLEVGADIDLDAVVTEIASASALAQRAGRVNRGSWPQADEINGGQRFGTFEVVAPAGIDPESPGSLKAWHPPYSDQDIVDARIWLDGLDDGISAWEVYTSELPNPELSPLPEITHAELTTASIASVPLGVDIDPDFYIEDPSRQTDRQVAICARRAFDDLDPGKAAQMDLDVVAKSLDAAPPRAHELVSLPIKIAQQVVSRTDKYWVLSGNAGTFVAVNNKKGEDDDRAANLTPGDVVVIPAGAKVTSGNVVVARNATAGITDVSGVNPPDGGEPDIVLPLLGDDVKEVLRAEGRGGDLPPEIEILGAGSREVTTRADRNGLKRLVSTHAELDRILNGDATAITDEPGPRKRAETALGGLIRNWQVTWCAPSIDAEQQNELKRSNKRSYGLLVIRSTKRAGELPYAPTDRGREGDQEAVTLCEHQPAVERRLRSILNALDCDPREQEDHLLTAARYHDQGKVSQRFQDRMGSEPGDAPLAKPKPRHKPDRGDGWRHEQLSAAYVAAKTGGNPFAIAYVAGHHGEGWPCFDRDAREMFEGWEREGHEPENGNPDPRNTEQWQLAKSWAYTLFGGEASEGAVPPPSTAQAGPASPYETLFSHAVGELGLHRFAYFQALLRCADIQVSREGN